MRNNSSALNIKKYRPNLPDLMQLCECNYLLLCKLLLNKQKLNKKNGETEDVGDEHHFFISPQIGFTILVKEVTRYTTLVHISQSLQLTANSNYGTVLSPAMQIRLYHDARVAEVNSSQNIRWIKPRYDYPNEKMHLPDEKQQINQFLKEWLQLCLQQGQVHVPFLDNDLMDEQ